jgi:DNA-binding transcriptional LysR family regulator
MDQSKGSTQLLRDMALFVEVAQTKSFSKAALRLEMPASTLSRRIAGMERAVGLRLLNRTTRRVDLSEAGAAYFARCLPLVEEARIAHEQLVETTTVARGVLRLTCSADFATLYLPRLLVEFTQMHPQVSVELDLNPQLVDLATERFDAALRIGTLRDSTLVARPVGQLQLGLFAAPSYLSLAAAPREPEDLARHVCIRMRADEPSSTWRLGRDGAPEAGRSVTVTGRFVAGGVAMVRELTLLGSGIGAIDKFMAAVDVAAGRLVPVLPGWHLPGSTLTLLTPSRLMPARVRLFGDFLELKMRRDVEPRLK